MFAPVSTSFLVMTGVSDGARWIIPSHYEESFPSSPSRVHTQYSIETVRKERRVLVRGDRGRQTSFLFKPRSPN